MKSQHRAIARYRLILTDWSLPRKQQVSEIERGLNLKNSREKMDSLNAELKAQGKARFGDPLYGIELTNSWDCMTPQARERQLCVGKKQEHFYK
jgi:hypothetical protein